MSGRIRTLKPEMLDDEIVGCMSDTARVLFDAMILLADDYGNLRATIAFLKSRVWAYREPAIPVEDALAELTVSQNGAEPLVMLYESTGQRYAHIRSWAKHQKVDHPGKPRVPPPPNSLGESREGLAKVPETLAPDPDLRPPTKTSDPEQTNLRDPAPADDPPSRVVNLFGSEVRDEKAERAEAVRRVFDRWCELLAQNDPDAVRRTLSDKRRKHIQARLREYTVTQLLRAVEGIFCSAWHVENKQTEIASCLASAEKVDRFLDYRTRADALIGATA